MQHPEYPNYNHLFYVQSIDKDPLTTEPSSQSNSILLHPEILLQVRWYHTECVKLLN